jgi:hypothetical protein
VRARWSKAQEVTMISTRVALVSLVLAVLPMA